MKKYEYKFVKVDRINKLNVERGDTFEICKDVINEEAQNGWRLNQVVIPFNEKTGIYRPFCYQIIFERELEENTKN